MIDNHWEIFTTIKFINTSIALHSCLLCANVRTLKMYCVSKFQEYNIVWVILTSDSWGRKESDTTERLNWTELNWTLTIRTMLYHYIPRTYSSYNWKHVLFEQPGPISQIAFLEITILLSFSEFNLFFRFHTQMILYTICLSLSGLLHYFIIPCSFICIVAKVRISLFFLMAELHSTVSILPSVNTDCFLIVNNAAKNTGV